jgi:hypothetical protein
LTVRSSGAARGLARQGKGASGLPGKIREQSNNWQIVEGREFGLLTRIRGETARGSAATDAIKVASGSIELLTSLVPCRNSLAKRPSQQPTHSQFTARQYGRSCCLGLRGLEVRHATSSTFKDIKVGQVPKS